MVIESGSLPEDWKVTQSFIEEKTNVFFVHSQTDTLEHGYVIIYEFFISKVMIIDNEFVECWIRQHIIEVRLLSDVWQQNSDILNNLYNDGLEFSSSH